MALLNTAFLKLYLCTFCICCKLLFNLPHLIRSVKLQPELTVSLSLVCAYRYPLAEGSMKLARPAVSIIALPTLRQPPLSVLTRTLTAVNQNPSLASRDKKVTMSIGQQVVPNTEVQKHHDGLRKHRRLCVNLLHLISSAEVMRLYKRASRAGAAEAPVDGPGTVQALHPLHCPSSSTLPLLRN